VSQELPRDVFIQSIYQAAKKHKDVVFLCCDLGAKALDAFRVEVPNQLIHTGISEQNMMDVAAGLAQCGKRVFTYAMAPFVTFRCFEQIKVALGAMAQPVTIIGVGVGFGYDDAGPTHYATEDLTCMRSIAGIEIHTPSDTRSVTEVAELCLRDPKLRYVRLDRKFLPDLYAGRADFDYSNGVAEVVSASSRQDVGLLASGYTVHTAMKVAEKLMARGVSAGVIDVFRLKPLNTTSLLSICERYQRLVSIEEHFLSGGFGSTLLEAFNDAGRIRPIQRLGVRDHYYFENGGRSNVHKLAGIDPDSVLNRILEYSA
jgi:transketolase